MSDKYCWGIFWENGERAHLETDTGPDHPENFLKPDDPWVDVLLEAYPRLTRNELDSPLGEDWGDWFIIVNPPGLDLSD